MAIKDAVEKIVKKIPKSTVFDSHFIISELIKSDSDSYGVYFKSKTNSTHGRIGKVLKNFAYQQNIKSFSSNIHGKGSKCTLWKKK